MAVESGACGNLYDSVLFGFAEIRNWTFNMGSNNPKFGSSNVTYQQHQRGIAGQKAGTVTFDALFDYDTWDWATANNLQPGTTHTLLLFYHAGTVDYFFVPVRIESIEFNCPIEDGEMVTISVEASTNGRWRYYQNNIHIWTSQAICA